MKIEPKKYKKGISVTLDKDIVEWIKKHGTNESYIINEMLKELKKGEEDD